MSSQSWTDYSDDAVVIGPNSCIDADDGSYTLDNEVYSPNPGEPAYWRYQAGTTTQWHLEYSMLNAHLSHPRQDLIADMEHMDLNANGVTDATEWTCTLGVHCQYNIWDDSNTHSAVLVGKRATATDDGILSVTLAVQNRRALPSTNVVVTDTGTRS
ncbi:MAG: hypothetical protein ACJATT_001457 [Myxococcota bacterium]